MNQTKPMPAWAHYFTILLACTICYGNSLSGEFVFDDTVAIVQNADITKPGIDIVQLFQHDFWGNNITDPSSHKSYRPLTTFTFRLEVYLYGGLRSTYMKFANFLLHCIVCILLKILLNRLFKVMDQWTILRATVFFAVHPIHTEAVSGIVGRADLLCTIMFLLVIFNYLSIEKDDQIMKYALLIVLTTVGLLFKETGIMALPTCIAYDFIKNTNLSNMLRWTEKRLIVTDKKFYRRITISILITICLIYIRLMIMNFESPTFKIMDNPVAAADNLVTKLLSQSFLYSLNLWLLLCPHWLSFDWALGSIQLIELPNDIRIISIILTYLFIILIITKGSRNIHFALAFMIVPFLPASGIIKLGFVIAERILYIPSIGFCILVNLGFQQLSKHYEKHRMILNQLFIITLIVMCLKTRLRANEWTNEDLLFKSALNVCPNNAKVYYNIARLASDRNDRQTAFEFYHKAINLYPEYEAAIMNLGNLYREINDLDKAEQYLRRSLELLEEFPAAWMNLGIVLVAKKQYNEAIYCYNKALKYRKRYATCYYNFGNLYIEINENKLALRHWQEAVALNPTHGKAWANILAYMDNSGRIDEVLNISEKALKFVPNDPAILFTRANAFGKLDQFEKAEQIYKRVIRLKPDYALYYVNLGVLYHRWNRPENAIDAYRNALKIDKSLKSATENLNKLLRQRKGI